MQGLELAAISAARSDFQNFFEVATAPCKNAGNLAGGHLLSSLFSLLSVFFHLAGGCGEGKAMVPAYARWIAATQS